MIRTTLLLALLSGASHTVVAQCRPVELEAVQMTSVGRVLLGVSPERGEMPSGAPNTFVYAVLMKGDQTGYAPGTRIQNIWLRRDSVWTALRVEPRDVHKPDLRSVIGRDGPAWNVGTNIDVITEWQVDGERTPHCSLLRSTVNSPLFIVPTVILKESTVRDSLGVAKNSGRLVLALRDANKPLSPIKEKSFIVVDTALTPGRSDSGRQVFAELATDIIPFDRLPARQVVVTMSVERMQYFRAFVHIVAGCETVMEVYLAPAQGMHMPPVTPTHATVTTCAPVRCLGINSMVIPCTATTMPARPPIVNRKLQQR